MTDRHEYSTRDAAPRVLYAKKDANSTAVYPVLIDADGYLMPSGKGAMTHRVVTVGTTAILVSPTTGTTQLIVSNIGASPIYVGGSGVTSSAYAFAIYPRQAFDLGAVKSTMGFYIICAATESSSLGMGEYS